MSDITAGPSSGAQRGPTGPWNGGSPPPVLLGALGAALLIAITVMAFAIGSSSGGGDAIQPASSGAGNGGSSVGESDGRVRLRIVIDGSGGGEITVAPAGITCSQTCSNDIVGDTRVTVTADANIGSTFKGWGGACDGKGTCRFYMDRSRELDVTFDKTQAAQSKPGPDCDKDGIPDSRDPGSCDDPPPAVDDGPPAGGASTPGVDCSDGIDNDGDGLVDSAQDPGCDFGAESATAANPVKPSAPDSADPLATATTPAPPPPPPPPAAP
jgi:hypothetical protein